MFIEEVGIEKILLYSWLLIMQPSLCLLLIYERNTRWPLCGLYSLHSVSSKRIHIPDQYVIES